MGLASMPLLLKSDLISRHLMLLSISAGLYLLHSSALAAMPVRLLLAPLFLQEASGTLCFVRVVTLGLLPGSGFVHVMHLGTDARFMRLLVSVVCLVKDPA